MIYLKLKEISGKLPTSTYELYDGELFIGIIQIRHEPSHGVDIPESMASHIYYEIIPEYRSKGYGKKILSLGLAKAREIGLSEIFITCMDDNVASKKIIEVNGGVFINEDRVSDQGINKKMFRYKITI